MEMEKEPHKKLIIALSIIIPLLVVLISQVKVKGVNLSFLPPAYAAINGATAVFLLLALSAIRRGRRERHELLMKVCIALSTAFLLMYTLYHVTSESTPFGGEGAVRYIYYFILITHITLSVAAVPLVLFTFSKALGKRFENHKKLAKIAFPIWLYVAASGVVVYLMIRPYY